LRDEKEDGSRGKGVFFRGREKRKGAIWKKGEMSGNSRHRNSLEVGEKIVVIREQGMQKVIEKIGFRSPEVIWKPEEDIGGKKRSSRTGEEFHL